MVYSDTWFNFWANDSLSVHRDSSCCAELPWMEDASIQDSCTFYSTSICSPSPFLVVWKHKNSNLKVNIINEVYNTEGFGGKFLILTTIWLYSLCFSEDIFSAHIYTYHTFPAITKTLASPLILAISAVVSYILHTALKASIWSCFLKKINKDNLDQVWISVP